MRQVMAYLNPLIMTSPNSSRSPSIWARRKLPVHIPYCSLRGPHFFVGEFDQTGHGNGDHGHKPVDQPPRLPGEGLHVFHSQAERALEKTGKQDQQNRQQEVIYIQPIFGRQRSAASRK
jgi:hypothetical protein